MHLSDSETYEKYAGELVRFATGLVGPDDAADVAADAFVRVLGSVSWPEVDKQRAYLFRAVLNDPLWELCLVAHDGVLGVVPFESSEGLVARVTDPDLTQDVLVPLDTDRPVGIRNTGPLASVAIEYLGGTVVGAMSAPWSPSSQGN